MNQLPLLKNESDLGSGNKRKYLYSPKGICHKD